MPRRTLPSLLTLTCLVLLTTSNLYATDSSPSLQTKAEKAGYTFGYWLAAQIRSDDVQVDLASTMLGFQDAANGKQPVLLDVRGMDEVIRGLRNDATRKSRGEAQEETAADPARREEEAKKTGYTLGYRFSAGKKLASIELNFGSATRGFRDAMDGKQPVISGEEMERLTKELEAEQRERELRQLQETIVKNWEESEKFLKENAKKEGVRTTKSGLQYRVLKEGDGAAPKLDDMVTIHYKGAFVDGTEFDNSYQKGMPQTIQTDGVIKGWTEALQMMKVGSKWQLFVPPELGLGRRGLGEKIPPNKVLVFEIELLSTATVEQTQSQ